MPAGTGPTNPDPPDPERLLEVVARSSWVEYGLNVDGQLLYPIVTANAWELTESRVAGSRLTLNAFNLLRGAITAGGGTFRVGGIEFVLLPVASGDVSWAVASTT